MDSARVALLRELLDGTEWVTRTRSFARGLRRATNDPGDLLLVGTPTQEPWHFAAHLDDEARYAGVPEIAPTLVRWAPPPDAPPHLAVGIQRLEQARRGESLLVVSQESVAPDPLLERVDDARRTGATIFALDGGDSELVGLAHDSLVVPDVGLVAPANSWALPTGAVEEFTLDRPEMSFDAVEHLVSMAVGDAEAGRRMSLRDRLAQLIEKVSGPDVRER